MESTPLQSYFTVNIRPRFQRSPSPPHDPDSSSCFCSLCFIDERLFPRIQGRNILLPVPELPQPRILHWSEIKIADVSVLRDVGPPGSIYRHSKRERRGDVSIHAASVARSVAPPPGPIDRQFKRENDGDVSMRDASVVRSVALPHGPIDRQCKREHEENIRMDMSTKKRRKNVVSKSTEMSSSDFSLFLGSQCSLVRKSKKPSQCGMIMFPVQNEASLVQSG
ncbi:hypothetical protein Ac2012v2_006810 [Leucoagaricus gongylophorus]